MLWINFLHCYQPVNADTHIIKEAGDKSYRRVIKALAKNPNIKFTINICGCLFLRWQELRDFDIINNLKSLISKRQIEITGSAAYHPILPLIPSVEAIRQIKENEQILKKFLGDYWIKPKGFFLPEMAYSPQVAKIIKSFGYQWLILDEIACAEKLNERQSSFVYKDKSSGLKIIFRSRFFSKKYVPEILLKKIADKKTIITATDCELYGLRHFDYTGKLEKLLRAKNLDTLTISEYIKKANRPIVVKIRNSSWESTENELNKNQPYALWKEKGSLLHRKLWELAWLACQAVEKFKKDKNYYWMRWHLVRGLASCTFWWASARDFKLFSSISWNPDIVERGVNELIRSIRSIDNEKSRPLKIRGEKLQIAIKKIIWHQHWNNYWKRYE